MLQIDASIPRWIGEERPCSATVGGIDDATGKVTGAFFAEAKTTQAYMTMLRRIVEKHGVSASIYCDHDSVLLVNTRKGARRGRRPRPTS